MLWEIILATLAFSTLSQAANIDKGFMSSLSSGAKKDAMLEFEPVHDKIIASSVIQSLSGHERRSKIASMMQEHTQASQLPVMNALKSLGIADKATPFWVANKIALSGVDSNTLKVLSAIPGQFTVREAQTVKTFPMKITPYEMDKRAADGGPYQWGVTKINAPAVYSKTKGQGIVVGVIDTGMNVEHVALKNAYKNDAYSWKDPVDGSQTPHDDNGHGTHCAGTIAGTENGIGVAPEAKLIACKALDSQGSGTEKNLVACGEFMACPNNSTGNCTGMPNIVSNSWGGGKDSSFFNSVIKSWTLMDMVPVFAIGNSGPTCGSASSPGDQDGLISVGATEMDDTIAYFSSKGPGGSIVFRAFLGKTKPEVSAPGVDIISADAKNITGYVSLSGTSMATPHVAGAAALYLSLNPMAKWTQVRDTLEQNAVPHFGSPFCPILTGGNNIPNNDFGYGRIDIAKATGTGT